MEYNKNRAVYTYDAVILCSGISRFPYTPSIPNMSKFKGDIMHSSQYKNAAGFSKCQKVLVVGNSSSGLDIAVDLCKRQSQVCFPDFLLLDLLSIIIDRLVEIIF